MSARSGPTPDEVELRRDIEDTRAELAATVDALAGKADLEARAREVKERAVERGREARERVSAQADELAAVTGRAAGQAQRTLQERPLVLLAGALALAGLLIGLGWRARTRRNQAR